MMKIQYLLLLAKIITDNCTELFCVEQLYFNSDKDNLAVCSTWGGYFVISFF